MDESTAQLIVTVESLKLKVKALEDALLNINGFTKVTEGSREGQIAFSPKIVPDVKPAIVEEVAV